MKRWAAAWLIVLLGCLPIWLGRADNAGLLRDTDTIAMLERIEARSSPMSWFTGDWPLENHFYRPISTLVFELDQWIHPNSPSGFGMTNALLAIACVLALFWFLRELLDDVLLATASALLFAWWNASTAGLGIYAKIPLALAGLGALASLLLGRRPLLGIAGVFVAWYASTELDGLVQIRGGALDWIPGRTATTMTLFALVALACYARYERLGAVAVPASTPTALDRPATKGTAVRPPAHRANVVWACAAVALAGVAFGAYEQAVMLPACLLGVGVAVRMAGLQPRWGWQIAFWALIPLYLLARRSFLPSGPSQYQLQQYRHTIDVFFSVMDYLFPRARDVYALWNQFDLGFMNVMLTQVPLIGSIVANAVSLGFATVPEAVRKGLGSERFRPWLVGYLLSAIAFLPMAWLKPFPTYNHYHYWALAFRSLYAVATVCLAFELVKLGATPRAVQAPARPTP